METRFNEMRFVLRVLGLNFVTCLILVSCDQGDSGSVVGASIASFRGEPANKGDAGQDHDTEWPLVEWESEPWYQSPLPSLLNDKRFNPTEKVIDSRGALLIQRIIGEHGPKLAELESLETSLVDFIAEEKIRRREFSKTDCPPEDSITITEMSDVGTFRIQIDRGEFPALDWIRARRAQLDREGVEAIKAAIEVL